ncbi:MAG: bifunctional hydroxymethylpyrimidine kinase/phosphomethylpyrimidine kinase [Sphingomonadales bacterium]
MTGRVLIIAGSDSGGGAGIQADIKTVTALGGYAATAITAITVQNTLGVSDVLALSPALVAAQAQAVLDDIGADALKTGMLHDAGIIHALADVLHGQIPFILDPVMIAKGGAALLADDAVEALVGRLIPQARLVTPNAPEATRLTGIPVEDAAGMARAGAAILEMGAQAVLVKGGHMPGDIVLDLLVTRDGSHRLEAPRIDSRHTHGTGCTLASAIATGVAQGMALEAAVARASQYVRQAIRAAPGLGGGHGPLGHGFPCRWEGFGR